jgi:hypothetical protein
MLRIIAQQSARNIIQCTKLSKQILRNKHSSIPKAKVLSTVDSPKESLNTVTTLDSKIPVKDLPLIQIGDYVEAFR